MENQAPLPPRDSADLEATLGCLAAMPPRARKAAPEVADLLADHAASGAPAVTCSWGRVRKMVARRGYIGATDSAEGWRVTEAGRDPRNHGKLCKTAAEVAERLANLRARSRDGD